MRAKCTLEQPSGTIPSAEKGVENVAFSDAITPSQRVADVTRRWLGHWLRQGLALGSQKRIEERLIMLHNHTVKLSWDGRVLRLLQAFTPAQ